VSAARISRISPQNAKSKKYRQQGFGLFWGWGGSTATEQHQLHKQQQCASCATNAPSHTHGEAITANTYTTATRALALS